MGGGGGPVRGGSGWGVRVDGKERRIEAFVKIKKKKTFWGGGDRVEGGGGCRVGGQGGCEQRSKVFVKIQKKNNFF